MLDRIVFDREYSNLFAVFGKALAPAVRALREAVAALERKVAEATAAAWRQTECGY